MSISGLASSLWGGTRLQGLRPQQSGWGFPNSVVLLSFEFLSNRFTPTGSLRSPTSPQGGGSVL